MIIKLPPGYDISHWKEVPDFNAVNPKPLLFITKATEGVNFVDDKFIRFAEGFISINCIRGFYHFFRNLLDTQTQARHFINTVSKIDILPSDVLILDMEETGTSASQMWLWFETVKRYYPDNLLMLYSRKNLLDLIPMTPGEKEYFKKIITWPAGYPYFPDLYNSIPPNYIPDQSKYGKALLWQYSAKGKVTGIIGDVDLNLITPELQSMLGSNEPIGVTMANYKGVCTQLAKVWKDVGMAQIGLVQAGQAITGDSEKVVSGIKYIHLTSPIAGWSKSQWFNYSVVTEPPPSTDIVPTEVIVTLSDGSKWKATIFTRV